MKDCQSRFHLLRCRSFFLFASLISILILIAATAATNTNTPSAYASAISSICINPSIFFYRFVLLTAVLLAINAVLTFIACLTAHILCASAIHKEGEQ